MMRIMMMEIMMMSKTIKISPLANEIRKAYVAKKINKQDLYELYREKYIEYAELKTIEIRR